MMQTENNKVIAEFMGTPVKLYKEDEPTNIELGEQQFSSYDGEMAIINNECFEPQDLKYHTSWDWLMPIVEKIRKSCWDKYSCTDKMGEIFRGLHMTDIERTYKAVIQFITWYNQQK